MNFFDPSGHWIETVFDLFSLGASVVEVVINPADPWAWAGLVGDALDLLPFVTGVGEGVKAAKLVKYTDEMIDASHVTLKFARATEYAKSFADGGEMLSDFRHVGKYGFSVSDHVSGTRLHSIFMKGEALNALNKVDGIDHASRIIYELKPYNRRNFRNGVKQLRRYRDAALQKYDSLYSMVLVLY